MIKSQLVHLGARIPSDLKKTLLTYCDRKGIKLQFFVMEAIEEKLEETLEDGYDNAVVNERRKNSEYVSEGEMDKYLERRKKKG